MKITKETITFTPTEKVEVTATEKHPAGKGSKRSVPVHMVDHLVKKGMIEDPNPKKGK